MTEERSIRVVLVDDHRQVHQAVSTAIEIEGDIELIGHASNGREALRICGELQPDIVIMDVVMPGMDGIEATYILQGNHPEIKILALSSFRDIDTVREMLKAGATGFVLKDAPSDDIASVIRAAHAGHAVFSIDIADSLVDERRARPERDYGLTRAEREVLELLVRGYPNQQISDELTISLSTTKFHVSNIIDKLGVNNRTEAVVVALRDNLLE